MASPSIPRKLWEHPCPAATNIGRFRASLERHTGQTFPTFHDLHHYSIKHRSSFWDFCWQYFQLIHEGSYEVVVDETARIDTVPRWFEGVRLNFAENLLFSSDARDRLRGKEDDKVAVVAVREAGAEGQTYVTWKELRSRTGRLVQALKAHGVKRGDRIAACASNSLDTLLVFLATTALGAIFSSVATDMGTRGLLDRLEQIKPVWLFMDDFAVYNRKKMDLRPKMAEVVKGLDGVTEFQGVVAMPRFPSPAGLRGVPKARTLDEFLVKAPHNRLEFERVRFRDPFLLVYSSGTTGQPKCIVHSVGGVLLNAYKEGSLHQETGSNSVVLQYTTTGWIMYLAQVQSLLLGARIVLYDGSPFLPHVSVLIELAAKERVTHLGISPRYLYELQRRQISPREIANLGSLQLVISTGMVLPDSLFEWFYDSGFPPNVRLNNMSGGTDIAGCFGTGNSLLPVHVGGCAGLALGIPVEVYEPSVDSKGVPVADGTAGELVATAAFPNMPVSFWGQDGNKRYHKAYFAEFDGVWTHGDFISIHPITKQLFFHGRADGVLNPSGVRFGSSEIYQVIESVFSNEVEDSLCVGQRRPSDNDERVILFLKMKPNAAFSTELARRVRAAIRKRLSARHVPSYVFPTPEIPVTVNFKKVELPVKKIISGIHIQPSSTLANPECLDYYAQYFDIEKMAASESKL
ncbi:AMP-binding enzyme [Aspergillus parasiticus SU-1]|uniref:AMP-binding enzyme n=1 Tax=Aspergillus parasiticus (strain ATCC 56775 / NRRL 5862 / SRRC 143 / SU-1) TaxID=1403190 RepID=A0A0F0I775_ASPPU|nr:AMP-binding enzyme [Aspergillus parasiticus SU-1]